jgi:hypothetical protein
MVERRTLAEDLASLEATNPEVAEASAAYDRTVAALVERIRAKRAAGEDGGE